MHTNDTSSRLAVTVLGGTGKTGRRVVRRLAALGHHVRSASRSTGFDWDDTSTWDATVAGADAVYLSYAPDISADSSSDGSIERNDATMSRKTIGDSCRPSTQIIPQMLNTSMTARPKIGSR